MKKFILLLVTVSCFGGVQAQRVTKIYVSNNSYNNVELNNGDTLFYKGEIRNVTFRNSFEFTNGSNQLNDGDSVIIKGSTVGATYEDADLYTIDGKSYKGLLFIVPAGGIAPHATYKFNDMYPQAINNNAVDESTGATNANAKCVYVSTYGNLETPSTPDKSVAFYLIQNTTSISESAIADVQIFPTLASNDLHLTHLKNTDVSIYSLVGQQIAVYKDLTGDISIDISTISNGIYFVKIQNGSSVRTEKIKIVR